MAAPSRRDKIEAMLEDDPADVMLRYMLAMELDKDGEHERCLTLFRDLMQETPPHIPSFVMAGQLLARLARVDEARATFKDGIALAREQGDAHAAGEMTEFLAGLPAN